MPYIKNYPKREKFEQWLAILPYVESKGELTYLIDMLMIRYIRDNPEGLRYQTSSDAMAACRDAESEWQQQVHRPYEDSKITEETDLPWPKFG